YLFEGGETALVPDGSFGVQVYDKRGWIGFSFNHLFHNRLNTKVFSTTSTSFGYLKNHLFVATGYRFELNSVLELEPSVLLKLVTPLPAQMDFSARFIYQEEVWLGLQYRLDDAFVVTIGYEYKKRIHMGYSFDYTTSTIKSYSEGSHEVMLGYRFNNNPGVPEGDVPVFE
ncbi:MAG: PorP/SprF family type IX secretion system membrane protein, partial [Flavobacteriales bacterium]|nr:PorP/SprF family type IX secretion system membrane protein [Flavobacteriales bacterium]